MEIYVVLYWFNHSFMQQIFKPLLCAKHSSRHWDREGSAQTQISALMLVTF